MRRVVVVLAFANIVGSIAIVLYVRSLSKHLRELLSQLATVGTVLNTIEALGLKHIL